MSALTERPLDLFGDRLFDGDQAGTDGQVWAARQWVRVSDLPECAECLGSGVPEHFDLGRPDGPAWCRPCGGSGRVPIVVPS